MPTGKLGKVNSSEHNVRYLPTKKGKAPKNAEGAEVVASISPFSIVPMTYNGGGILASPEIVALYWGNFAAADVTIARFGTSSSTAYDAVSVMPAGLVT